MVGIGWDEAVVLKLAHIGHIAGSPMECVPDFEQHAFAIAPPLVVPKAEFFDVFFHQELFPFRVVLLLVWQAMLEAVQFHGEAGGGTEEIQVVDARRMLAAELETGKTTRS